MIDRSSARALLVHEGLPLPVEIRPIRNARRLRLRYDERRQLLTLTGPLRMNRKAALDWAAGHHRWVVEEIAARAAGEPFEPDASIPVEGVETVLVWSQPTPQKPLALQAPDGPQLVCGGPASGFATRIERHLKRLALETLTRETMALAERAGLRVTAVSIGDAGTRWGSCSSDGRIRFSWRLILAPSEARRFVVAHEVAHLRHLDHGPGFKALERQLFGGDVAEARRLLRSVGPRLRRLGRGR